MDRSRTRFAVWLPDPLTVATWMLKSFVTEDCEVSAAASAAGRIELMSKRNYITSYVGRAFRPGGWLADLKVRPTYGAVIRHGGRQPPPGRYPRGSSPRGRPRP